MQHNVILPVAGARLKANLTQARLAEKLGIRQNMISDYERGKRRLSPEMAARIGFDIRHSGPQPIFNRPLQNCMEQVMPVESGSGPFDDPICRAVDLTHAGESVDARKILMDLCQADLRCLDAHFHLGNFVFDYSPQKAIEHYEVGLRIGELSLGDNFTGVLAWDFMDNRPFLHCMKGYGLCLWRLGRFQAAEQIFTRMLWLNPSDNQGARFFLDEVKSGITWEDSQNRN